MKSYMNLNMNMARKGSTRAAKIMLLVLLALPVFVFGQEAEVAPAVVAEPETRYSSAIAYTLLGVTVLLMVVIYFLGKAVALSAATKLEKSQGIKGTVNAGIFLLLFHSETLMASSTAPAANAPASIVSAYLIYLLLSVILLEFVIILYFTSMIFSFLKPVKEMPIPEKRVKNWFGAWFMKENSEADIASLDLGHNYDGIKELDNDVPSWWKYGFYISIIIAVVYLYVYHIGNIAPLQQEELRIAMASADQKRALALKDAKNNVDENTVTMLAGADLEAGRQLFLKPGACATCHGADGGGMVNGAPAIGPNLTDKYWLHKGSLRDIFYSIKYGWPEKGMKSWKEDYSPAQMAQIASYVKSLQGSKPAAVKEKQGELWEEIPVSSADSSGLK